MGVLGLVVPIVLLSATFTEWIGVHAFLGSFLIGVVLGNSPHFRKEILLFINKCAGYFFAPIFFVSIGLKVNFNIHFDWVLTLTILAIACAGKIVGCGISAKLSGSLSREALAIGFGMNSRGAMEIILGLAALQYGLIGDRVFVSLVFMAIFTSLISGPLMRYALTGTFFFDQRPIIPHFQNH